MKRALWKKIKEVMVVVLALLGLIVAASDGKYFPWANFAGLFLACIIVGVFTYREEMKILSACEELHVDYEPGTLFALIHALIEGVKRFGGWTARIRKYFGDLYGKRTWACRRS
jgi:hypothetical protein